MLKNSYRGGVLKEKFRNLVLVFGVIMFAVVMLVGLFCLSSGNSDEKCKKEGLLGGGFFSADRCSADDEKAFREIVLVVGATQNTPKPSLIDDDIKGYLKNSLVKYEDAKVSTITVSEPYRNPDLVLYDEDEKSTNTVDQFIKKLHKEMNAINSTVEELAATEDGADYLEAIRTAASSIKDKSNSCIVVIGSGLSDKGLINFAGDDLLNGKIEKDKIADGVYEAIENKKELNGVRIIWDGAGATTLPQTPLGSNEKDKIKDVYKRVLRKLGAVAVEFVNSSNNKASVETKKKVQVTKTYNAKIDITQSYDESTSVRFRGNEATFVDRAGAEAELEKSARYMLDNEGIKVEISTFMARGQLDCSEGVLDSQLLANRANVVKDFFISRGVNADRIKTVQGDFGSENECPDGFYEESQAMKNRKVDIHIFN